mgnify:CR=1 FL=1
MDSLNTFFFAVSYWQYQGGEVWRGGNRKKVWLSSNGQTSPSVCGLPFVSLVPLQMAVVELQRLYHKVGFLPSGYRLRYELGYPFITESGLLLSG